MGIFIGGDTQELEYDFGLKVSGSVAECPMKIYKQEVDPANLPDPTTGWTEITSQSILDKLKSQNELPVTAIATDKSTVTWNSKTLPKTSTLKVLDDFVGKIVNSTVENPHIVKRIGTTYTTLASPTQFNTEPGTSYTAWLATLGGPTYSTTSSDISVIPQQLFSFNLIEMFERKFGAIPKETVAEKVAWLKSNIIKIMCYWTGYGSCPTGNKAYLIRYNASTSSWSSYDQTHTANTVSSPTTCSAPWDNIAGYVTDAIDSNGFVHFLASTDSARTTDSTLLVLTGHGLSQWDVIENATRGIARQVNTINSANYISTYSVTGQTGGDAINKYHNSGVKTASIGTTTTNLNIVAHGLSTGDFVINNTRGSIISKITVVDADNLTISYPVTGQTSGDIITLFKFTGQQTAESTVIPSTIYTDYVSLELTLKAPENLITATNTLSDIVTDFTGKVVNSTTECANIAKSLATTDSITTSTPSYGSFSELVQSDGTNHLNDYNDIKTLDSVCSKTTTSTNGGIARQLFSFNIVSAVEKALGQPIPAVDKVQWCKDYINKITVDWTGYGSCPTGNKAYLVRYDGSSWLTANQKSNTTSSPSTLTYIVFDLSNPANTTNFINSDGFGYMLAYTDSSDGVTSSIIYTDYIKLTIHLKYIPTYDFYTDSNTRRDAGLTDIVLVKRTIGDMVSDFTGKVYNDVVSNPNIAKRYMTNAFPTTLIAPSSFGIEYLSTGEYDTIKTLNGACMTSTDSTLNHIAQQLFQFNLIGIAQRALGTSIPGVDTASKVQWLKDNINTLRVDWYGFGSCPSGNRANLDCYANSTRGWDWYGGAKDGWGGWKHTLSSITNLYISNFNGGTASQMIYDDGFVNILASAPASDSTTASVINTDYVKITLTFKSDTVGYEYFTNNSAEVSVTTSNKASAYLIECDLTPISNALYGGSNAALKSALKSITADVYAMGSGANVNSLGNNVVTTMWSGDGSLYGYIAGWSQGVTWNKNILSSINKIKFSTSTTSPTVPTTTNKIYILIYSTYKSDGTIASEVNLDYVNIKIGLARVPDVISNPPQIELTDTWSMLVRGFSPSWDNYLTTNFTKILCMRKDSDNYMFLELNDNRINFRKKVNGIVAPILASSVASNSKYQTHNILFGQNSNGMFLKILKNNGTVETIINSDKTTNIQSYIAYPLHAELIGYEANAFLDSIVYLPNQTFDDVTAEAILRGTKEGYEFAELFNINNVTLHANATRSNGVITLNATALYQNSYVDIPVLPNNKYRFEFTKNAGAYVHLYEKYNNSTLIVNTYLSSGFEVTTSSKTNKVRVLLGNDISTGIFTFSNISLKLKM